MLNNVLQKAGFDVSDVRLLRHQDNRSAKDRTPYKLWWNNLPQFDFYQATQGIIHQSKLKATYWASFIGTPSDETMFVGIYRIKGKKLLEKDMPKPHMDGVDEASSCHVYDFALESRLEDLIGKMLIN
jgi:hypothetical protein